MSEAELERIAEELAARLRAGDRVIVEGPMGAGKSTFARALLRGLGVEGHQAGSPTFAIAHEYALQGKGKRSSAPESAVHLDLYRLRTSQELDEAGIPAYFWERDDAAIIVEWLSMFPELERAVLGAGAKGANWRVTLEFAPSPELRQVEIQKA